MGQPKIHIVIPVYDHAEKLAEVIQSLFRAGYHDIIVVNDGSTREICNLLPAGITHLRHRVNLGQGAALQTGFAQALADGADMVVCFDADGQHDPADIKALVEPIIAAQADITSGSRFMGLEETSMPAMKIMLLKTARMINFLFTGMMLSDAHNGLRAINKKALEKIRITENRMAHATEILFEIKKHKLLLKEVPVRINYTDYSLSHGQSTWNSIKIFFDILFYKLFA